MRFAAIVVAAGSGVRFGRPKHDLLLAGTPLWKHSVATLRSAGIDEVVVVGDVEGGTPGGPRRRDSVAIGIAAVDPSTDWLLVHDAARPLVTRALVSRVIAEARKGDADGVVPALAVTDTLKSVSGSIVLGTVDRGALAAVQTPQGFRREALAAAHALDPESDVTDDAGLIERLGGTVVTVPGETTNMKITFEGDLEIASLLFERLRNE